MKAITVRTPGDIALEDRPLPAAVPAGLVRVRILAAGICGTDYHIFHGRHPFLSYPRLIGHELGGEVAVAGGGFAAGDRVVVNPYLSCGTCRACTRGQTNCCTGLQVLGVHRDGGMAEYIDLPPENLIPAGGLSPRQTACVEFLAIGAHAVRRSGAGAGDRALVIGAGPIGLGAALFARLAGAEVHLLDASAARLALVGDAFGLGHRHLLSDGGAGLAAATGGAGFDVVFDATGNARAMEAAFAHVGHGGSLVYVGVVRDSLTFDDAEFHKREMRVIASRNATADDLHHVMATLAAGQIDDAALVTHVTTLDAVARDLPAWAENRETLIKAMVLI